jgi:hypothetical protein
MADKIVSTITLSILRMEDSPIIVYSYFMKSRSPLVAKFLLSRVHGRLVPRQPGIDKFLGLLSNPVGFHQDFGTESDHEQEVRRAVIG